LPRQPQPGQGIGGHDGDKRQGDNGAVTPINMHRVLTDLMPGFRQFDAHKREHRHHHHELKNKYAGLFCHRQLSALYTSSGGRPIPARYIP
jgi:hypothetical protein